MQPTWEGWLLQGAAELTRNPTLSSRGHYWHILLCSRYLHYTMHNLKLVEVELRRYATINPISQSGERDEKCKYLDCYLITHRKGEKGHLDYQWCWVQSVNHSHRSVIWINEWIKRSINLDKMVLLGLAVSTTASKKAKPPFTPLCSVLHKNKLMTECTIIRP